MFICFILMNSISAISDDNEAIAQWQQCSILSSKDSNTIQTIINNPSLDAVYLEADTGTISTRDTSHLKGNVIIQQNDIQFNADQASYDRNNFLVNAQGNVVFSVSNSQFKSKSIHYNLKNKTGLIEQAEYKIGRIGARGISKKIKLINKNQLSLNNATFSTCPTPKSSWHIASSTIQLNNKTQIGTAKNVTFKVKDVPIFYFPWLNFPLNNQRLSGFLTPSLRLQSNAGFTLPYYLNLAPNYDATLTLSSLSDHGLELDTEFRYLTSVHAGTIEYDFIPEDKSFNNHKRDYFKIEHHTTVSELAEINLTAEGVSDKDYFNDFSTSLEDSSRSSLKRRLEYKYQDSPWLGTLAIEDYQILDIRNAPYARLPEFQLKYEPKSSPNDLKIKAETEIVYFDKEDTVTGSRSNLKFQVSHKWGNDAWFFKPSFTMQHTLYSLNNHDSESIGRSLPTFTLDSGFFFDREFSSGNLFKKNKTYTQTLEPRLFYTYTPFKDQSDIPIFDTSLQNFSATNQLFSENRFTGKDRIADNNQLTFAVTSRIQDRDNGRELITASIGQVFNFTDKKVTLPGGTIQTGKRSDLVLELSGRLNDNFRVSSTALLSHERKRIPSYELRLNYQDDKKRIANIRFRKLDTELKQVTVSTALPISNKWSMVASTSHDLDNDRNLEALVGLEYQDCCWKARIVAKRYLTSDNRTYETPVFLEFELKGLGNIGTGASSEIKDKIYGYDDY